MQSGRVSVSHATGVKNEDESYPAEGMGASNTHDADADADDLWPSPSMSATGPLPPWPPRSGPAAAPMPFASPLLERESTSTGTRPPLLLPPPPASAFDVDAMGGFQLLGAWPASPRPPAAAHRNDADSNSTHSLPFAAPAFSSACAPPPPPFFSKACIDNGDNGVSGRACTTSTFSLAGVGASSSSSAPRFSSPAIFMPPFAAAVAGMGADNAGSGRGMRLAGGHISAPPPSAATFAPSPLARSACAASQHTSEQMERAASTSAEDVHQEALRRASPDAPPTSPESAASSPVAADANPTPVLPKRSSSHSNGSGSAHGNAPNASDAPMSSSLACARSIDDRDGDSGDGDRAGGDEVRENVRASATAFLLADGTDGVAPDTPRRPRARSFDNGHGQPPAEGELIPDHEQERAMQSADSTASVTATLEELSEWRRLISDKLGDPFFLQALRSTRSGASLQNRLNVRSSPAHALDTIQEQRVSALQQLKGATQHCQTLETALRQTEATIEAVSAIARDNIELRIEQHELILTLTEKMDAVQECREQDRRAGQEQAERLTNELASLRKKLRDAENALESERKTVAEQHDRLAHAKIEHEHLEEAVANLERLLQDATKQQDTLSRELAERTAEYEHEQSTSAELSATLAAAEKTLADHKAEREQEKMEATSLREAEVKAHTAEMAEMAEKLELAQEQHAREAQLHKDVASELAEMTAVRDELVADLSRLQEEATALGSELDASRQSVAAHAESAAKLVEAHKQALSEAQEKVEAVTEQLQENEAALSAAAEKAAISDARIAALEASEKVMETTVANLKEDLASASGQLARAEAEQEDFQRQGNIKERIGADKLKAKQEELDEVFERLTSALAAKELAEAKSEQLALSLEQHQAQLAAARDDATAREHEKQHELQQKSAELAAVQDELAQATKALAASKDSCQRATASSEEKMGSLQQQAAAAEKRHKESLEAANETIAVLEATVAELVDEVAQLKASAARRSDDQARGAAEHHKAHPSTSTALLDTLDNHYSRMLLSPEGTRPVACSTPVQTPMASVPVMVTPPPRPAASSMAAPKRKTLNVSPPQLPSSKHDEDREGDGGSQHRPKKHRIEARPPTAAKGTGAGAAQLQRPAAVRPFSEFDDLSELLSPPSAIRGASLDRSSKATEHHLATTTRSIDSRAPVVVGRERGERRKGSFAQLASSAASAAAATMVGAKSSGGDREAMLVPAATYFPAMRPAAGLGGGHHARARNGPKPALAGMAWSASPSTGKSRRGARTAGFSGSRAGGGGGPPSEQGSSWNGMFAIGETDTE